MKAEFVGKKVFFLGDSLTQHGHYLGYMRSYFQGQREKCYIFNRGIGGNTTSLAKHILGWEIGDEKPDYTFVCFGVNDMGAWLYDAQKEETEELLEKRRQRDEEYFAGHEAIVDELLAMGIQPVLVSPASTSETFVEKENIETLGDNKEKGDYIGPSFYTHKTFAKLNAHLAFYKEKLKEMAERKGVLFCDLFTPTNAAMWNTEGLFNEDGVHYSKKGHGVLAKAFLEYLGCGDIPEEFPQTELSEKIYQLEYVERSAVFLPCATFNPKFGAFTLLEMVEYATGVLSADDTPDWLRRAAKNFLERRKDVPALRQEILDLTYQL